MKKKAVVKRFRRINEKVSEKIGARGVFMKITKQEYSNMVKKATPPSKKLRDFSLAFIVGGFICVIGQLLRMLYQNLGLSEKATMSLVPITLVFIAALLTGLDIFEKLARFAGAGTLVPITGFANAVVSPAIEFKPEGHVLGIGVKMFTIAGPVILFGTLAGVVYGVIYWIMGMI